MKKLTIGEPCGICSAITVPLFGQEVYDSYQISQNSQEFWINCCIGDYRLVINKKSAEGLTLAFMIEKLTYAEIRDFLEDLVIKHLSSKEIVAMIEDAKSKAYREGAKAKLAEIKSVLGLD